MDSPRRWTILACPVCHATVTPDDAFPGVSCAGALHDDAQAHKLTRMESVEVVEVPEGMRVELFYG